MRRYFYFNLFLFLFLALKATATGGSNPHKKKKNTRNTSQSSLPQPFPNAPTSIPVFQPFQSYSSQNPSMDQGSQPFSYGSQNPFNVLTSIANFQSLNQLSSGLNTSMDPGPQPPGYSLQYPSNTPTSIPVFQPFGQGYSGQSPLMGQGSQPFPISSSRTSYNRPSIVKPIPRKIRQSFGENKDSKIQKKRKKIGYGATADVYEYSDDKVVKIIDEESMKDKKTLEGFKKEAYILENLNNSEVKLVPKFEKFVEQGQKGRPEIIMERASGTMDKLYEK